jgi:glycine cleavage system H protein
MTSFWVPRPANRFNLDRPNQMESASDTLLYRRARFVAQFPRAYRYSPAHFWIAPCGEHLWRVGLTKFGSRMLGEIVDYGFEAQRGARISRGETLGWIEGFKAVSELFCIADGEFVGPNPALEKEATLVNRDPHGAGWLYAIHGEPDPGCTDAEAYARLLDQAIDHLLRTQAGSSGD